jgi:integrase
MRRRPKGSGTIIREGAGWSLRIKGSGRPTYETGFRTRQEAEDRAALIRAETVHQRLGMAADPRLAPTLAELAKAWFDRREVTHASGRNDRYRWDLHLAPVFGRLRPDEVGIAEVRAFVEGARGRMAPGSIRVIIALLSSLYEDLIERRVTNRNPCRGLPGSLLRLMRPDHDPRTTPFLERLEDVRRVYLALREEEESIAVAFAIGALAGLRTGEVFALRWRSVDLASRRILVSESVKGPTKDRDPRVVPIVDPLAAVLEAWKLRTGGTGLVIEPLRSDGGHMDKHTPGRVLRPVLHRLGFVRLAEYRDAWYAATRHSFASHWAMAGRPLRELQALMGHSSIAVTERYAHLAPGAFAEGVYQALAVDLGAGGRVVPLPASPGDGAKARARGRSAPRRRGGSRAPRG